MNGFERLKEQIKDQKDQALKQTVDYLISRYDMEQKYLNEDKTVKEMCKFIKEKGYQHVRNGWNYITNEVVYAWAIMYWSLPNEFLKIKHEKENKADKKTINTDTPNNVVSLEEAKKKIEEKKQVEQLTLFGGVMQ